MKIQSTMFKKFLKMLHLKFFDSRRSKKSFYHKCTNDRTTQWTIWMVFVASKQLWVSNSKSQVLYKRRFLLLLNSTQNILTFFVGGFHRSSQSSFEKPSSMATIWQFPAYWMMASLLHHHFKITPRTRTATAT